MHQLEIDFEHGQIRIKRECQQGVEMVPDLADRRRAILEAVLLPDNPWKVLKIDFDERTVRADGLVLRRPQEDFTDAVYKALGYEPVDLAGVVSTIEEYVNGRIDDQEMRRRMDEENN